MATHSSILAWEMPRTEEPDGPQSMGRIKVGLNPATTNRSNSKDHTQVCVCVCVCVCVSPLAVLESVSESSCISASVSPDSQPPARSSGPGLSQALWLWLRSLRRPAVSLGVGACECLCVCLCACLWLVCSLRKVEGLAWGQRGASVVRRGGAEALRSTAPPWLLVGLGTGQVLGKLGAQVSLCLGPQELQRPLGRGGWEAAGAEDRHLRGRAGLSSEWDPGEALLSQRGRVWSCRGWEGAETSAPLSPAPRPRAHARTHALPVNGGSWKTLGPRARPGACWSGIGGVRGAGRRQQAGVRSPVLRLKYSTPPDERCGPLARPAV